MSSFHPSMYNSFSHGYETYNYYFLIPLNSTYKEIVDQVVHLTPYTFCSLVVLCIFVLCVVLDHSLFLIFISDTCDCVLI